MDWTELLASLGAHVVPWALTALLGLLSKLAFDKIKSDKVRRIVRNATAEVFDVVAEVNQTFVKAIKAGNEDGKLTDAEKEQAKDLALEKLKSNLGAKGFERLVRVFGSEDSAHGWLATKLEAAVSEAKVPL